MEKINWEQRRYELAKEAMGGILSGIWSSIEISNGLIRSADKEKVSAEYLVCTSALAHADEMIKQLRKD